MLPRVLSRYFARRFTATLFLMLGVGSLIIFLADYVEVLRRFSDEEDYTSLIGLQLAAMHVPILLDTALPFALLFAALLTLLDLSRRLEIVVVRASGVSVWGFLRAPFAIAILFGAAATTILNPIAVSMKDKAENLEAELHGQTLWGNGYWFRQEGGGGSSIVHVASAEAKGTKIFGVTAFVYDDAGRFREKIEAPHGEYAPGKWVLTDGTVVSAEMAPHPVARYELPTSLTADEIRRRFVEPETISVWSLPGFIATAERTGLNPGPFQVAFHALVNRPVFFLAMVLIAATVSLRLTRYGGTWRLILTGATIGFLLYAFGEIASDLGGNGIINPVLAAWLPPIVALTFGATALLFQEDG
jgi:lipopolysaccharide export system permease protein